MNKKLLAAAVAGALAAPGVALAQVTINGIFKVGIDSYSLSGDTTGRQTTSEMRVTDNSSRVIIGVSEDLGGGLSAIGQWDIRAPMDSASSMSNSGNTWVGLRSTSWGSLTLGRHDLHYGSQPDDIATKAGALMAASISLMDYAGSGLLAIANTTRTPNSAMWSSPNWGGFNVIAGYSTTGQALSTATVSGVAGVPLLTGQAAESDLTLGATGTDKGSSYNLKGQFTGANWQVGGSLWNSKADGTVSTASVETTGQVVYGYMRFGGLKVGAAMNMSTVAVGGTDISDRSAFTIPASFVTGPHNFYAHYTVADKDDILGADTGAKMYAFAYVYDLSKRTSVGVTYAKIDNEAFASYNFFTNTGGLGSTNSAGILGEDGQLVSFTIRHAF